MTKLALDTSPNHHEIQTFFGKAEKAAMSGGRLIFALDATASREATWDLAAKVQYTMFHVAQGLNLQLVFYRGEREVKKSSWVTAPEALVKLMSGVCCAAGNTQIARVLSHVQAENQKQKVDALVFVGDAMEENPDLLVSAARNLGTRAFLFQEGQNPYVEKTFREIARVTNGAYGRFDDGAAQQLADLLRAVVAFVTGGKAALAKQNTEGATLLLRQLDESHGT